MLLNASINKWTNISNVRSKESANIVIKMDLYITRYIGKISLLNSLLGYLWNTFRIASNFSNRNFTLIRKLKLLESSEEEM